MENLVVKNIYIIKSITKGGFLCKSYIIELDDVIIIRKLVLSKETFNDMSVLTTKFNYNLSHQSFSIKKDTFNLIHKLINYGN